MPNFPLTKQPSVSGFRKTYKDHTVKFEYEGGYVVTRARARRAVRIYSVEYLLNNNEKNTVEYFFRTTTHMCANSFTWTKPDEGTATDVRLTQPPDFIPVAPNVWKLRMEVEEL